MLPQPCGGNMPIGGIQGASDDLIKKKNPVTGGRIAETGASLHEASSRLICVGA
jgi:hypothetical protein